MYLFYLFYKGKSITIYEYYEVSQQAVVLKKTAACWRFEPVVVVEKDFSEHQKYFDK